MRNVTSILKKFEIVWHWKYWPTSLFHAPVMIYVFTAEAIKARRVFFFAAANPGVPLGGFSGDSKYDILQRVPEQNLPKTIFVPHTVGSFDDVVAQLEQKKIGFPLIVKPDIGERGFLVKKLKNIGELREYHYAHDMAYIIQEFIAAGMEFSVLVHNASGDMAISSLIQKEYMSLKGNGKDTIKELLMQGDNTRFKKDAFKNLEAEFDRVLGSGEKYVPLNIGNLSYGTKFIDLRDEVDSITLRSFKRINDEIGLFNYARYDVKCETLDDLKNGKFYVLEINGVKGEPLHIYTHEFKGIDKGYGEVFRHWAYVSKISRRNIARGARCPGLIEGCSTIARHLRTKRRASRPRLM